MSLATLIRGVELLKRARPGLTLNQALAFLYACENEGVSLHELALLARIGDSTLSRSVRTLSEAELRGRPDGPLLEPGESRSNRTMLRLELAPAGRALREQLDDLGAPASAAALTLGGARRRRSWILASLELVRAQHRGMTFAEAMLLLYVLDEEGIDGRILAQRLRVSQATVSRSARSFFSEGAEGALPPAVGLIEARLNPINQRTRLYRASPRGRDLYARLAAAAASGVRLVG